MRSLALGVVCVVGCSIPTPIGELQSDVADSGSGSGGSSTTTEVGTTIEVGTTEVGTTELPSGSEVSSSGGAVVPEMTGFAIRWGDVPEVGDTDTGMSDVGSGPGPDPDGILVVVGYTAAGCEDVFPIEPCGTWNASFTLAPDQQVPGTYDGSTINAGVAEIGPGDDPNDCAGYGGGTLETTLIVESIDDTGLQIRFEGVDGVLDAFDLEGFSTFVPRC